MLSSGASAFNWRIPSIPSIPGNPTSINTTSERSPDFHAWIASSHRTYDFTLSTPLIPESARSVAFRNAGLSSISQIVAIPLTLSTTRSGRYRNLQFHGSSLPLMAFDATRPPQGAPPLLQAAQPGPARLPNRKTTPIVTDPEA